MKIRTLEAEMCLPLELEGVFALFSEAANLDTLTLPWLHFHIRTPRPIAMHAGQLIEYQLRVHGIPLRWQSEITLWDPPCRFVDEQRRGPYRRWVHCHDFECHADGTRIHDQVEYAAPGGMFEPLLQRWFVGPDLRAIFTYRQKKIRELLAPLSCAAKDRIEIR